MPENPETQNRLQKPKAGVVTSHLLQSHVGLQLQRRGGPGGGPGTCVCALDPQIPKQPA